MFYFIDHINDVKFQVVINKQNICLNCQLYQVPPTYESFLGEFDGESPSDFLQLNVLKHIVQKIGVRCREVKDQPVIYSTQV